MAARDLNKGKYSKFLVYLAVVVLVNIAGITLFFRADLTSSKVYSLSKASRDAVATLSEPLTVKVFFNTNLPAPYNNIERYLHDLMEEYSIEGGRHFNYQFHNVSAEEDAESRKNQELAQSYGIQPVQIQNIEQDEVKFQKAFMGMVLLHGDLIETLPTITSTDGLEYEITSAIRKMNDKISAFLRLREKVSVKLILSSSLRVVGPYMNISGLLELPSSLEHSVNRLNDKNFGKLSFASLDPTLNTGDAEEARRYNVLRLNWEEFKDRRGRTISADEGFAGIVVEYGDKFETIDVIEVVRLPIFGTQYQMADPAVLEKAINETVERVIDINEGIGYLADHGTLSIAGLPPMAAHMQQPDALSNLNNLLSQEYTISEVKLKDEGIPDGISTMIIAGAKENFTDYELYQIDQFLMEGKSLAIFMDSFNEVRPQQNQGMMNRFQRAYHMPVNTGLEKLLGHYGVNIRKAIVLDENSYRQRLPRQFGGGERKIYFAPIIRNEQISKEADYLNNIKGLIVLRSSPVEVNEVELERNDLKAVKLVSSSERSWEMSGDINLDPTFITPPRDETEFRSIPMAYMVEGSFPSYFAGKDVPEKPGEPSGSDTKEAGVDMSRVVPEGMTVEKGKHGRIFVIGTSEILKDNMIDEAGSAPNAQFVMNVIDYLNGRGDIAVMRSKTQGFNPLKEVSPATRTTIKTANIAGLPILVIVAGAIVWARRATRKRMIQKIFS